LNKFIGFINPPPPSDSTALSFLSSMFESYLGKLVGFIEVVGALLLVMHRTQFIGLLLLMPIMLNIIMFHLAHDNPGNGIWIVVSILFGIVIFDQKDNFTTLFKMNNK
jgi:putative oxidoreductase